MVWENCFSLPIPKLNMCDFYFICRELKDRAAEADASSGLGQVYQQLGEYNQALR